jgi:SAM-dependent methyltransferase
MGSYPLPSTDEERMRLAAQAQMMKPLTSRLFRAAGLAEGMRVLDVGSGAGDVALLAREFVGETGEVVGYDRDAAQVAYAQERADKAGFNNVRFVEAGTDVFRSDAPFDAAVGRFTLMYHPDMDAALTTISRHVRKGGALAFHEWNLRDEPGAWPKIWPPMEAGFQTRLHTIVRTMAASGVNLFAGAALIAGLSKLGETQAWAEQSVAFGASALEAPLALLRSVLPQAEALGLIGAGEIDMEAMRLQAQQHSARCTPVSMSPTQVLAWTRLR